MSVIRAVSSSPQNDCYSIVFHSIEETGKTDRTALWVEIPCQSLDHSFAIAAIFNSPEHAREVYDFLRELKR